jgi:hypothetical protein
VTVTIRRKGTTVTMSHNRSNWYKGRCR